MARRNQVLLRYLSRPVVLLQPINTNISENQPTRGYRFWERNKWHLRP